MQSPSAATLALRDAILSCGPGLRTRFGTPMSYEAKTASPASVVTEYDRAAERHIKEKLSLYDSSIGFRGEEFGEHGSLNRYWLIDPIDGTGCFVRGLPFCTTMGCLIEWGEVVCSVIYNFVTQELFWAEKGKGAYLHDARLTMGDVPLRDAYLSVESVLGSAQSIDTFLALRKHATMIQTVSSGYEFGLLVRGKIEGRVCFEPYGQEWDYAPGMLLVKEAGGRATNIGVPTYTTTDLNVIATNPVLYEELMQPDSPLAAYFPKSMA